MPLITAYSQTYKAENDLYWLGDLARGEHPLNNAALGPIAADADADVLAALYTSETPFSCFVTLANGKFDFWATDIDGDESLEAWHDAIALSGLHPNFVGATWSAGSPTSTITSADPLVWNNNDVEAIEVLLPVAMQELQQYFDIASVSRLSNVLTVQLDETNRPYDVQWDNVWAQVADWLGGELP